VRGRTRGKQEARVRELNAVQRTKNVKVDDESIQGDNMKRGEEEKGKIEAQEKRLTHPRQRYPSSALAKPSLECTVTASGALGAVWLVGFYSWRSQLLSLF
jgi:hypothetical protein